MLNDPNNTAGSDFPSQSEQRSRTSGITEYGDPREWDQPCIVCGGEEPCSHDFDSISWPNEISAATGIEPINDPDWVHPEDCGYTVTGNHHNCFCSRHSLANAMWTHPHSIKPYEH